MKVPIPMKTKVIRNAFYRPSSVAAALAFIAAMAGPVHAGSATWNVGSGDWGTAGNWSPASVPGTAGTGTTSPDVATFQSGGAGTAITVTDTTTPTRNLEEIVFNNSGSLGNYTIGSGANTLYFTDRNTGGSTNPNISFTGTSSAVSETIASNIMITGATGANDLRIAGVSGESVTLTLSGNISTVAPGTGTSSIRIVPEGASGSSSFVVNLSGNITDGGAGDAKVQVTSATDGVVVISGADNTYSGGYVLGVSNGDEFSVLEIGVSSTGPAGAPTSGPLGTGTFQFASGTIESNGTAARTIANNFTLNGNGSGVASPTVGYWFGSTTNTGLLTFTGNGTLASFDDNNITTLSNVVMSGALSNGGGPDNLIKEGAATLTLSGNNTYSGGTTIAAGALEFGSTTSMPATGTVAVDAGATLAIEVGSTGTLFTNGTTGKGTVGGIFSNTGGQGAGVTLNSGSIVGIDTTNAGGSFTYAGNITNSGVGLTKLGTGTLVLTGGNLYTGTTTIAAGALQLGSGGTTGSLSTSSAIVDNGTFVIDRNSAVSQGVDFSGSAITGSGGLTQAGTGTTTLSAANSYTGTTTVSAGTLQLSNGSGSATGAGALNVGAGATLAGRGSSSGTGFSIAGTSSSAVATVLVGQTSPSDINTTHTLSLTGSGASNIGAANLVFNLNTNVANQGNELGVGATAIAFNTVVGMNTTLTLNLQGSSIIASGTTYVLIAGTTASGGSGQISSQYTGLDLGTSVSLGGGITETKILNSNFGGTGSLSLSFGGANTYYGANSSLFLYQNTNTGQDDIEVEVVPEPGTWAMMLGGLSMLLFWQRRKNGRG